MVIRMPWELEQKGPSKGMVGVPRMEFLDPLIPTIGLFSTQKAIMFNVIHGLQQKESNNCRPNEAHGRHGANEAVEQYKGKKLDELEAKHFIAKIEHRVGVVAKPAIFNVPGGQPTTDC